MFRSVSAWLERVRRQRPTYATATAEIGLGPALGHLCLLCRQGLKGHEYAQLAITVATPERKPQLGEFIRLARDQNWGALKSFHEFEGDKNALAAYAIRCSEGRVYVILVRDPVELYDSDEVLDVILDVRDMPALNAFVPEKAWQSFF